MKTSRFLLCVVIFSFCVYLAGAGCKGDKTKKDADEKTQAAKNGLLFGNLAKDVCDPAKFAEAAADDVSVEFSLRLLHLSGRYLAGRELSAEQLDAAIAETIRRKQTRADFAGIMRNRRGKEFTSCEAKEEEVSCDRAFEDMAAFRRPMSVTAEDIKAIADRVGVEQCGYLHISAQTPDKQPVKVKMLTGLVKGEWKLLAFAEAEVADQGTGRNTGFHNARPEYFKKRGRDGREMEPALPRRGAIEKLLGDAPEEKLKEIQANGCESFIKEKLDNMGADLERAKRRGADSGFNEKRYQRMIERCDRYVERRLKELENSE